MNRDEQLTRATALPPRISRFGDRRAVCPSEPGGGTWIALNDTGACFALINWYAVPRRAQAKMVSRGRVVAGARFATNANLVERVLAGLPLKRMNPFRLVGVFPANRQIVEWRWDLRELNRKQHRWRARQWLSSGFDERTAMRLRSQVFHRALRQRPAGTLAWLRRLHRSHLPEPGPFSTCVHRSDAATVSYSEISVSTHRANLRYYAGAPCHVGRRAGAAVEVNRHDDLHSKPLATGLVST